jgi:hypothetical protein
MLTTGPPNSTCSRKLTGQAMLSRDCISVAKRLAKAPWLSTTIDIGMPAASNSRCGEPIVYVD